MSAVEQDRRSLPDVTVSSPFDTMASGYDVGFTHTPIGRMMRQAVWRRLDVRFKSGDHVLELNCGTGEDALYLAQRGVQVYATDVSMGMVKVARAKVERAEMQHRVTVRRMAMEDLGDFASTGPAFDGALSNFGGLNCVSDWSEVAAQLAACLRPGAVAVVCVMGPYCVWEWLWYLSHKNPDKAFRRLRRGGTPWRGLHIRYPSIRSMNRAFAPWFRPMRVSAVGTLIPPTYAGEWAERHPRLLSTLNAWERRIETLPGVPSLADHFLIEFERLPAQPLMDTGLKSRSTATKPTCVG